MHLRLHGDNALKRADIRTAIKVFIGLFSFFISSSKKRLIFVFTGYRYVSSTERYWESNLDGLKDALSKHHPLR
ncbi:MAG TPA: hypothetical protein VIJ27_11150 [Mucilaginibacter sp.]